MGFLDNSGDITLDAVLTDTGRMRLAKGDGSFKISKFALGDDEINYGSYNKFDTRGSSYYDIDILQTPVLEAFTNNIANLNSRLVSYSRNNWLFLPVIKINYNDTPFAASVISDGGFIMAVDKNTEDWLGSNTSVQYNNGSQTAALYSGATIPGLLRGFTPSVGSAIRIDQGIDNESVPAAQALDPDLMETQYLVEMNNKYVYLTDANGVNVATPTYIDDDGIAAYYISKGVDNDYFYTNSSTAKSGQVIAGSRGDSFKFKLTAAMEVSTTDYLFTTYGNVETSRFSTPAPTKMLSILTSITVTGLTTGCMMSIPVLLLKANS